MKEVILKTEVGKLGKSGDVVKVKNGYARNFLLPKGLALEANAANLKKIEQEKKAQESQKENIKQEAQKLAEQISGASYTVSVEAMEDEKLYGEISSVDISQAIETEKNIKIDKKDIIIKEPIQSLGIYEIEIRLHPEVSTKVRVWVTKK